MFDHFEVQRLLGKITLRFSVAITRKPGEVTFRGTPENLRLLLAALAEDRA